VGNAPSTKIAAVVPIAKARARRRAAEGVQRFKFTAARIDALALPNAGEQPRYHYDAEHPRLAIAVSATGVRTFYVVKKVGRRVERFRLGRYDTGEMKIDGARNAARALTDSLAAGEAPRALRNSVADATTLQTAFDDLIANKRNTRGAPLTETTKHGYKIDFKNHLAKLADKPMLAINDDDARALHARVGRDHPTTANRVAALGSSIYGHALKTKIYAGPNPFRGIDRFQEVKRERFLRQDELPRFIDALAATPEPWCWLFALALFTGARRGNVIAARWRDFDVDAALWRIPTTKGGIAVTLPLSAEALAILKQIPKVAGKEFLFPSHSDAGHVTEPKGAWADLMTRAKLADLRIHDLRRTLGSWQAMTGASLPIIGKSLGHASHRSTEVYARLQSGPVAESVATATSAILAAARKGNRGASIRKLLGTKRR
jgi:integrase